MKITIETTRENLKPIFETIKNEYPDARIQILIQKTFDSVDLIQIGLSTAQVVIGIMTLIPNVLAEKKEPKIKITIKDEVKGRELTLEGNQINETKVVSEFIKSLDK